MTCAQSASDNMKTNNCQQTTEKNAEFSGVCLCCCQYGPCSVESFNSFTPALSRLHAYGVVAALPGFSNNQEDMITAAMYHEGCSDARVKLTACDETLSFLRGSTLLSTYRVYWIERKHSEPMIVFVGWFRCLASVMFDSW